jgi:hypothetical protein
MRKITMLVWAAMAAVAMTTGCGGPLGSSFTGDESNLTAYTLPPLQYFQKWDGRTPFVPSYRMATNFVTQVTASPYEAGHYRVYGIDATTAVIYFQVDVVSADLPTFLGEVGKEQGTQTVSAAQAGLKSYTWGGTGQIVIGSPPDPNPPVPGGLPPLVQQIVDLGTSVYKSIVTSESAY